LDRERAHSSNKNWIGSERQFKGERSIAHFAPLRVVGMLCLYYATHGHTPRDRWMEGCIVMIEEWMASLFAKIAYTLVWQC